MAGCSCCEENIGLGTGEQLEIISQKIFKNFPKEFLKTGEQQLVIFLSLKIISQQIFLLKNRRNRKTAAH